MIPKSAGRKRYSEKIILIRTKQKVFFLPRCRSAASRAVHVAAAAATAVIGGRQSHRAGWLEQRSDVLNVSAVFGHFATL